MEILTQKSHANLDWLAMFAILVGKMNKEAHLLHQTAEGLLKQFESNLSVIAVIDQNIIGHTTLWKIAEGWYEIGSTFVCPSSRGHDINSQIYEVLLKVHFEKNILATTTNKISLHIGEKFDFSTVTRNSLPADVFLGTCICPQKKTGSDNPLLACQLAWDGVDWSKIESWKLPCHVRVTPHTLARNPGLKVIGNYHHMH